MINEGGGTGPFAICIRPGIYNESFSITRPMFIEKLVRTDGKVVIINDSDSPTVEVDIGESYASRGWARLDNIHLAQSKNKSGNSHPTVMVHSGEIAITDCHISNRFGPGVQISGSASRVAVAGGFIEECETYGLVCKNGGQCIACGLERDYEQEGSPARLVDKDMLMNRQLMEIQKIVDIIDNGGIYQVPPEDRLRVAGLDDLKLRIRALRGGSRLDQIENVGKTLAQTRGEGKKRRANVDLACLGEDEGDPQFFMKNKLGAIYVSGVGSYLGMTRAKVWQNEGHGIHIDAGATATILGDTNEVANNGGIGLCCSGGQKAAWHKVMGTQGSEKSGAKYKRSSVLIHAGVSVKGNKQGGVVVNQGAEAQLKEVESSQNEGIGVSVSGISLERDEPPSRVSMEVCNLLRNRRQGCVVSEGGVLELDRVRIDGNDGIGCQVDGRENSETTCTLSQAEIKGNGMAGLFVENGTATLRNQCEIKGNQSSGIHAKGVGSHVSIESSTLITINLGCGLVVDEGAKVTMKEGSVIMKSEGEANVVVQGKGSTLEAQNVHLDEAEADGIIVRGQGFADLIKVRVVNSSGWGFILKDQGSEAKVDFGNVERSQRTGVLVKDGAKLSFKKGLVRGNQKGGIVVTGEGTIADIVSVQVTENVNDGFRVQKGAHATMSLGGCTKMTKAGAVVGGKGSQLRMRGVNCDENHKFGVKAEDEGFLSCKECTMKHNKFGSYSLAGSATTELSHDSNEVDEKYPNPKGLIRASLDAYLG